jgi:hypothetical protein
MKQKYNIGDLYFKTKKECENYTRNIINNLGCCIIKNDHTHFNFLFNLIQNHPEYDIKKGVGINYFYIIPNPINNKYYQTMIKRLDESEIDFSWVYFCQFKERTKCDDLIRSMRSAIKDDTIKYKQEQNKLICNFCKNENEIYENYHVDHHNPSFQTLKNDFLQLTTKPLPLVFDDNPKYNLAMFNDKNEIQSKVIDRSIFLDECITELENL